MALVTVSGTSPTQLVASGVWAVDVIHQGGAAVRLSTGKTLRAGRREQITGGLGSALTALPVDGGSARLDVTITAADPTPVVVVDGGVVA